MNTIVAFVVVDGAGTEVGERPSFHEARVWAKELGSGFRVETRRRPA